MKAIDTNQCPYKVMREDFRFSDEVPWCAVHHGICGLEVDAEDCTWMLKQRISRLEKFMEEYYENTNCN